MSSESTATFSFQLRGEPICIRLSANEEGLTACEFLASAPTGDQAKVTNQHLLSAARELKEYFAGKRQEFETPLAPRGTPFQHEVWSAAKQIFFGQTRSYWWIAVRIGNPYAMRAVGGALGANPLLIFVPCHRVLRQDGSLGGFACGTDVKRRLLEHEQVSSK